MILVSSLIGCEKIELTDYAAYAQAEIDLLNDFYTKKYNFKFDSLVNLGIDTIDERTSTGILLIHRTIGDGDKVEYGKQVGFRYTRYHMYRDSASNSPQLYTDVNNNNLSETDLFVYTSGSTTNTTISNRLDYALRKLNKGGQATILIPSTSSSSGFNEVWDINIQYVGK